MDTEPTTPQASAACPNCETRGPGPFCAACGRRMASTIPTTREFLGGVVEEFGGIERRFFRTLRQILTRPGRTTLDIAEGLGAAHVSPVRMYLALALVYFAVAAASPLDVPLVVGFGFVNGDDFVNRWVPRIVFLGIPAFAALLWMFYRRSGFVRHLVFAVYLHAAVYAMNATFELVVLVLGWLGVDGLVFFSPVLNLWFIGYLFLALRRLEGGAWKPAAATLTAAFAYAMVWGVLTIGLLVGSGAYTLEQLFSGTPLEV